MSVFTPEQEARLREMMREERNSQFSGQIVTVASLDGVQQVARRSSRTTQGDR